MKVALIFGFYSRVEGELRGVFSDAFDGGNLIWIGRAARDRPDLTTFKDRLFKIIDDGSEDPIHVFLAVLRKEESWVLPAVDGIIAGHQRVQLVTIPSPLDSAKIVEHVKELGLHERNEEISEACVAMYLAGKQVLCVRPTWQTDFKSALLRARFPPGSIDQYFCERIVQPSQNSNLAQELREASKQYGHLLYAYKSLRHAPKDLGKRYEGHFFQDETTAGVVGKLKKDILNNCVS